jgi:CHAT domain-containing protein/tetratricopeptide (TPR) repeat protein
MPRPLTPQQRERLKERDRLFSEAEKLNQAGKLLEALAVFEKKLAIEREVFGDVHAVVADSLAMLARGCEARQDFAAARKALQEVVAIRAQLLGARDWRVTDARLTLADLGLRERLGPAQRAQLNEATRLNQQGFQLWQQGKPAEALPLMQKALAIREELQGKRHRDYALGLFNLAAQHQAMGDYPRALPLYEQARDLIRKLLGEEYPDYAISLNNLALLYQDIGDNPKALPLFEQARDLTRKLLGEEHPDYAQRLNNLAGTYQRMGDYPRALPLFEQAHDLTRKLLGEEHPEYAQRLNNLANLYQVMGDYPKALPLFEQARDLTRKVLGEEHPDYAIRLNNLASIYRDMGDYPRAATLYQQALDLRTATGNVRHPDYATTLSNLGSLLLAQRDYPKAEQRAHQALVALQQNLNDTFAAQSQRQRLDLLNQSRTYLDWYLSVIGNGPFPAARVYHQVLTWKGSLAARQAEDRLAGDSPAFRDQLEQLRVVRVDLARLVANPPLPAAQPAWLKSFQDLEAQKEKLELKLAQLSQEFFQLQQRRQISADQVAGSLPQDAALIDFLEYTHGTPDPDTKGRWHLERRLLAFVLKPGDEPVLVQLGASAPINTAVQAWRQPITTIPPAPPDPKAAEQLAQLLWRPLRRHLGDAKTVLISPDGELCGLPFAALPGSKPGSFLLEEMAIGYLTSGRHQLETADPRLPSEGLLALGGLDFGKADPAQPAERLLPRFPPWSYLVGSQLELEQVERSWKQNFPKGRGPQRLSGSDIDKTRLQRKLAVSMENPRWRYLHLATHGFFTPPQPQPNRVMPERGALFALEQERLTFKRNPLLLSGLVLSQANRNPDAGLMTAEEVSALDLRGVELAVLSACETGLGRVADGQGVYGLQRAFQEAGAKSLVVSLWSVSDPATSLLMQEFYQQLWSAKPPSKLEALRQAQLKLLRHPELIEARKDELLLVLKERKQPEEAVLRGPGKVSVLLPQGGKAEAEPSRSHPAYWAPFVLSGDWR